MKPIDYENLYQNNYKKIPTVYFWITFVLLGLGSFITAIVLLLEGGEEIGTPLLLLGFPVAYLIAFIESRWIACLMSPKIVAVDCLIEIKKQKGISSKINVTPVSTVVEQKKENSEQTQKVEIKETFIKREVVSEDIIKCTKCGCLQKKGRETCWKCGATFTNN